MENDMVLTTDDLVLEPLLPSHAALLFDGLRDERIYAYIPQRPPGSIAQLVKRCLDLRSRRSPDGKDMWLNWAVRYKDGTYVGWLQATVHPKHTADVAYIIFPAYWRRGYAVQACRFMLDYLREECDVKRAMATVDTENVASIRVLEKLGFSRVSTHEATDMAGRLEHRYEKRL